MHVKPQCLGVRILSLGPGRAGWVPRWETPTPLAQVGSLSSSKAIAKACVVGLPMNVGSYSSQPCSIILCVLSDNRHFSQLWKINVKDGRELAFTGPGRGKIFPRNRKDGRGSVVPHPLWACVWTGYQVSETGDGHFYSPSTIVAEDLSPRNVEQLT